MIPDRKAAIRTRAHQLWEESGHAHGLDHQHWQQAEREYDEAKACAAAAEQVMAEPAEAPTAKPARKRTAKVIEPATEIPEASVVRKTRAPRKATAATALD